MKAIRNKKAYHDYQIIETLEVGIVLTGSEVKSVKEGNISLAGSYVQVRDAQLWLINAGIAAYIHSSVEHEPDRTRRLLAHRREIQRLIGKIKQKRLTLVPLRVYTVRGKIKLLVGMCRGRKAHEKKIREKERELQREMHGVKRKYVV